MPKNKLEQINQAYKRALAQILVRELPDTVELTVSDVLIDPSYQHGRVWLRTTPQILKEVETKRADILTQLTKYVQTRYTPKLTFLLDDGKTDRIDELFGQIKNED
jgi:ribosome-binding factor A